MKYLDSPKHRPMKRLDVIMGLIPVVGDMPYKELDALYSHVFSCVASLLRFLDICFSGFRIMKISPPNFWLFYLDWTRKRSTYLSELHSILYIPPPPNTNTMRIRPFHASLQDFLVNNLQYYLDEEAFHADRAQQCIRYISTLSMKQGLELVSSLDGT